MNKDYIKKTIESSINVKKEIIKNEELIDSILKASELIIECFTNKGKVLLCGNGGSAADAQHIAAEFTGRFYFDREPLDAEALHVNTSYLTAVANDYSYDEVFSRLVKAKGKKGDVLIGFSTSGNSSNVIKAFHTAKEIGIKTIAFTGLSGGKLKELCDILIKVPSNDTPRIQESHITIAHIICDLVEKKLFKS